MTREKTKLSTCPGRCKRDDAFREDMMYVMEKKQQKGRSTLWAISRSAPSDRCSVHCTLVYDNTMATASVSEYLFGCPCPRDNASRPRCLHCTGGAACDRKQLYISRWGWTHTTSSQIKVRFLFVLKPLKKKYIKKRFTRI